MKVIKARTVTRTILSNRASKDAAENLEYRRDLLRRCGKSEQYRETVWGACAKDPIYFMNSFAWTYDPRGEIFKRIPFVLYDFQEDALLEIINSINRKDILVEKSRDMGASWICLSALFWKWLFDPSSQSFLLVSRSENYVDQSGNPKSLMWKWDYLLTNLPPWLRPQGYNESDHRRKLHIENPVSGSVCDGESTNQNVARGDRRGAIMLDEFAVVEQGSRVCHATRDATNCRIFNSTPFGVGNAFYDMRQKPTMHVLTLHWSVHPLKRVGLYTTAEDGTLKILDGPGYPADYPPILDGKIRSPWYDGECDRATNAREIAQELDIDYLGSGYQFFDADCVQVAIRNHAMEPFVVGDLDHDSMTAEPTEFRPEPEGCLSLWVTLGADGRPTTTHKTVMGVDVSAGTGSSNSCVSVWDKVTYEKLAEYVSPYIRPEALAKQAVAIGKWFGNSAAIWESNGPGRQFGSKLLELGYNSFYLQRREQTLSKKVTEIPGWAPTREGKLLLLGNYRNGVEKNRCVNRSKLALEETLEYVFSSNGAVEHVKCKDKEDPSGAGASHGDRVIADALAWKLVGDKDIKLRSPEPEAPLGSLAWRNKMRKQEETPSHLELSDGWR